MWRYAAEFIRRFRVVSRRDEFVRAFERHGWRMVFVGKMTHILAGIVFMGAGYTRISVRRVMWYSFIGASIKAAAFFVSGYLAGVAYATFYRYFQYGSIALSLAIVAAAFWFYRSGNVWRRSEEYRDIQALK